VHVDDDRRRCIAEAGVDDVIGAEAGTI